MRVPADHSDREICIIGLGYVGLTLAVAMAEAGFVIRGVERDPHILSCLSEGRAHFMETALDGRLRAQMGRGALHFYRRIDDVPDVSVYIITVGTPLEAGAKVTNLKPIRSVVGDIAARLKRDDMVILRSTVRVGVTREIKQQLDACAVPYSLAFCPERTLEGKALLELRTLPQVVGGADERSVIRASIMFSFLTPTIVRVSSLEAAEMIKLVNNTQRDLMFAFANEVAEFCDALEISAHEVIEAGNMGYPRASMPKPGPVGGPCLEKDPYILAESVAERGGTAALALSGRELNESLPSRTSKLLAELVGGRRGSLEGARVAVAGLAFKGRPETSDLRGSMAIPLIAALRLHFPKVELVGYDPAVNAKEAAMLGIDVAPTIEAAFKDTNLVVFQNNNPAFERLALSELSNLMAKGGLIYDYWGQFNPQELDLRSDVAYAGLGTGLQRGELAIPWGLHPEKMAS
jgi:UDP-N-acetyl-D-mannosaminuronic acid dehydrogenase